MIDVDVPNLQLPLIMHHKGTLREKEAEHFLLSFAWAIQRLRGAFDGEQSFSNCTVFKYGFLRLKTVFCLFLLISLFGEI